MQGIFKRLNERKKTTVGLMTMAFMYVFMSAASAAGATADTATVTAVTDGMTGLQMTALAVVGGIAAIAVTLFAAPFAWQYGKKIFKTVAR